MMQPSTGRSATSAPRSASLHGSPLHTSPRPTGRALQSTAVSHLAGGPVAARGHSPVCGTAFCVNNGAGPAGDLLQSDERTLRQVVLMQYHQLEALAAELTFARDENRRLRQQLDAVSVQQYIDGLPHGGGGTPREEHPAGRFERTDIPRATPTYEPVREVPRNNSYPVVTQTPSSVRRQSARQPSQRSRPSHGWAPATPSGLSISVGSSFAGPWASAERSTTQGTDRSEQNGWAAFSSASADLALEQQVRDLDKSGAQASPKPGTRLSAGPGATPPLHPERAGGGGSVCSSSGGTPHTPQLREPPPQLLMARSPHGCSYLLRQQTASSATSGSAPTGLLHSISSQQRHAGALAPGNSSTFGGCAEHPAAGEPLLSPASEKDCCTPHPPPSAPLSGISAPFSPHPPQDSDVEQQSVRRCKTSARLHRCSHSGSSSASPRDIPQTAPPPSRRTQQRLRSLRDADVEPPRARDDPLLLASTHYSGRKMLGALQEHLAPASHAPQVAVPKALRDLSKFARGDLASLDIDQGDSCSEPFSSRAVSPRTGDGGSPLATTTLRMPMLDFSPYVGMDPSRGNTPTSELLLPTPHDDCAVDGPEGDTDLSTTAPCGGSQPSPPPAAGSKAAP
eukprot:TRINITY_DN64974_c0_g1_i1.p1 TRINITY_DN64974_c0_g1~~TRINITY_DN64974_c0_g1_i1.p1  ORF type:complete len:624 (+),score=133.70 TRINITY_DN64974_c0_g1_i1:99-1970(+)